jgi:hypothetical protein
MILNNRQRRAGTGFNLLRLAEFSTGGGWQPPRRMPPCPTSAHVIRAAGGTL